MHAFRMLPVLWAIVATSLSGQAQKKTQTPPDVFLVTIDTLRADHVHCYGYDRIKTPTLDELAKDGIRFAQAFTPSPITNSSHTSILTGLLPSVHGVTDFGLPLAPKNRTLAELLKDKGYETAAFIGSVVLDSNEFAPGLERGFDYYDNFPHPAETKLRWGRLERRGGEVVQRANAWLSVHSASPHFVWIHLYDPHDPYQPPPPYSGAYKEHLYDGEIAYADSALAEFFSFLRKHGWYDPSIIVVVGDHGEGLGEHHEQTHGIFLYDTTTHVPLIMKLPDGGHSSTVVTSQVRTLDILPTILDLVHVSAPKNLDGESLQPYFSAAHDNGRIVFGETDYPLRFGWAPLRSIRWDGMKLVEAPRPELYDLKPDPREETNVYAPWDANVQKFRAILADLRTRVAPVSATAATISQSTLEELKALGYLTRADTGTSTNLAESSLLPDPKDKIEEQNLLHRAMIAAEDGRSAEARAALEEVVTLDPQSAIALGQLGALELQAEEYSRAVRHLTLARQLRPTDSTLAFEQGRASEGNGDLSGAKEALEASLKLNPTYFQARLLLGKIDLELKELKAAEDEFEAALLLQPENKEARLGKAKALFAAGKFLEVVRQLEPMTRAAQSSDVAVFELLAQSYAALGEKEKAEQSENRANKMRETPRP